MLNPQLREIIDRLSSLDLTTYPADEIRTCLKGLGKFGCMEYTFHAGKSIMRARPNLW